MQQSSLTRFCDECGLANDPVASYCAACQSPLTSTNSVVNTLPIAPVTVTPAPVLEVTPGDLFAGGSQHLLVQNQSATGEFQPGTILDGLYRIEEEIGRGGFSIVYRAVELSMNRRTVVIKRIRLSTLSPRQVIDATETFNREITMLARFKGANGIPAFYNHLTDAENWYLVMQYIKGQTLEEYLRKAPGGYLKEEETLQLGIGLAEVMQYLHTLEPPVIYRDLKPSNIMLTPDGKFFLIDFGIARNFAPGKAKDTTPLGSPGYAPPEQYGRAQTDQQSDIYSLGATLQTMLTGRDPLELRAGETSRNPKPPSRKLRELLDEMLAPNIVDRPHNMAQVKKRLEFSQNHPGVLYILGLIYGAIFGIVFLGSSVSFTSALNLSGFPLNGFLFYIGFPIAAIIESRIRKKLKIPKKDPKGFRRFWVFGFFTSLLPLLLIAGLLHLLGLPI